LTLAGAEASIGLAILIIFYRARGIISVNFLNSLKG
jgi:NADH:ubiquinone oxidoreductase subunit K